MRDAARGLANRLGILPALRAAKWRIRVATGHVRQQRRFRWAARPALPIFGNAMAKSGSHILAQFLAGLESIAPLVFTDHHPLRTLDEAGRRRPTSDVLAALDRLGPGDIGWGYLPDDQAYLDWAGRCNVIGFFTYRDPRDKIVSHVLYAMDIHPGHAMADYYRKLESMEVRVDATIRGVPGLVEDVRTTYESYLGWLDHAQFMPLRFEDLIEQQDQTVGRMLEYMQARGVALAIEREAAIRLLLRAMAPDHSPTFRAGRTGDWRGHFTAANQQTFDEVAGDLLERLGYA